MFVSTETWRMSLQQNTYYNTAYNIMLCFCILRCSYVYIHELPASPSMSPQSMTLQLPVIQLALSLARNITSSATSSPFVIFFKGVFISIPTNILSQSVSLIPLLLNRSVFTGPGLTAFTLTPLGPNCRAIHFVNMSIAAFDMQYGIIRGIGLFDKILDIFTMFPFVFTK